MFKGQRRAVEIKAAVCICSSTLLRYLAETARMQGESTTITAVFATTPYLVSAGTAFYRPQEGCGLERMTVVASMR